MRRDGSVLTLGCSRWGTGRRVVITVYINSCKIVVKREREVQLCRKAFCCPTPPPSSRHFSAPVKSLRMLMNEYRSLNSRLLRTKDLLH